MAGTILRRWSTRRLNVIGEVFGKLTVVADASHGGPRHVVCRCECGSQITIRLDRLRDESAPASCGCYRSHLTGGHFWARGRRKFPEYGIWNTMKARCYNRNTAKFADYGGRGITVCDRWRDSFLEFLSDMGTRPSPKHTLDRIDNNKGYGPENCEWTIQKSQQQNRRDNVLITYHGETLCVSEWNRRLGLPTGIISTRMHKLGWDAIKAMTTPIRKG